MVQMAMFAVLQQFGARLFANTKINAQEVYHAH